MQEKDLKLKVSIDGAEETAKKVDKIADAENNLTDALNEHTEAIRGVAEQEQHHAEVVRNVADQEERRAGGLTKLAARGIKLATAYQAIATAIRLIPGVNLLIGASAEIISIVREETRWRLALAKAIREQGRALDELQQKQSQRRVSVENIASRRREGGFENADASRRAGALAGRVREQFEQISEADANLAAALLGDAPGVTQAQVTDLAFLAKQGRLQDQVEALFNEPPEARLRRSDRLAERFRSQIDRDVTTESQQGQGQGGKGFRPQVTEREQLILGALTSQPGGPGTDELVTALRNRGVSEPEKLALLIQGYQGDVNELFEAILQREHVALTPAPHFTRGDIEGTINVPDPNAVGFRRSLVGLLGLEEELGPSQTVDRLDLNRAVDAIEEIKRHGRPGGVDGGITYNDNRVYQHNGRYIGVGARGDRNPSRRALLEGR